MEKLVGGYVYPQHKFHIAYTRVCMCFKNIAFSNQLNFNLHNFLYVKVMCTKFDYFPLN